MRVKGIIMGAATGAVGLEMFATPAASASGPVDCDPNPGSTGSCGWINVEPDVVHRGDVVDVEARCLNAEAYPVSDVLLNFTPTAEPTHWSATVSRKARPGEHTATITCPENTYTTTFLVVR
ncbi:hypothetical protein L1857_29475 [Amycolatopsis thermalba]|uniref:Secreted protein n=1 Tax=Amycolatopsis thermalba TaxID=944492 RepID=A0ABY4P2X6_9PSEU|nr:MULTISPECIES: hypothetical protein [Amycolatopsis]UQS26639.1 hypothetical protein L1857_29475 [Amycolatopsis thermalba]